MLLQSPDLNPTEHTCHLLKAVKGLTKPTEEGNSVSDEVCVSDLVKHGINVLKMLYSLWLCFKSTVGLKKRQKG